MSNGTVKEVCKLEYVKLQKSEKQLLSIQKGGRDPVLRRRRIVQCNKCQMVQ